jgi:phosphoglucosamine mutase
MSGLKVLQVMKEKGATLEELADCMTEYPQELVNMAVTDKPPIGEVPALAEAIAAAEESFGEAGRVLVRYSGTEKKIRLLVECKEAAMAREQVGKLANAVEATIGA